MRNKGSCRFDSYFKVQVWNAANLAWKDIQKAFPTLADARANFVDGDKCRVMEITERGRFPVPLE